MRISVDHMTQYQYSEPVGFTEHQLHLWPRESHAIHVRSFALHCEPEGQIRWVRDCFNNVVTVVSFGTIQSSLLSFHCEMAFDVAQENPFDFILEARAAEFPFVYDQRETNALRPFLEPHEAERRDVLDWVRDDLGITFQRRDTIPLLTELNLGIHRSIDYERRDEEGTQTATQTLERGAGSCRDLAELFIAVSRQLGLAARFVSGYLYEPPRPDGSVAFNRAAGSMHAWVEIYLPGAGWRGFDPTNGILTDQHFLPAAVASRPEWASPVQGRYLSPSEVASSMHVELAVRGE
ncbi:MAG: transglutaminase family protein [Myxococcales bacterium]|nr:transglutaminase family protein [Myxococcales bacterium]MDH3482986.1 transglutaminase family protein [Myxococcales bacterium]